MGVFDIPDDPFWGPIYESMMYVATGQQLPQVKPGDMYALQARLEEHANSLLGAVADVDGLSAGVLSNVSGGTARAFADHVRGVVDGVPGQAAMARYTGFQSAQLGVNGEESVYEGWLVLSIFAMDIFIAVVTGDALGVPGLVVAGNRAFTKVVEESAVQSRLLADTLKGVFDAAKTKVRDKWWLAREVVQEGAEETVETGAPQAVTSLEHHRQGADV
ncbi:hypothetical protein, partial [Amycolatopsis sp. NPDC058986]